MAGSISFRKSALEAVAFVPRGLAGACGSLALVLALLLAPLFVPSLVISTEPAQLMKSFWIGAGYWLLVLVAQLMATGALYRLALGRGGAGPLGIQFTRVELRILGASILYGLMLFFILLVPGLLYVVFAMSRKAGDYNISTTDFSGVASLLAKPDGAAILAAMALMAVITTVVVARLRLYLPATVAENRMIGGEATALTRGSALSMILLTVFAAAPSWIWSVATLFVTPDGDAFSRWTGLRVSDQMLSTVFLTALVYVLQPVLTAGFDASAYRQAAAARKAKLSLDLEAPEPTSAPAPV